MTSKIFVIMDTNLCFPEYIMDFCMPLILKSNNVATKYRKMYVRKPTMETVAKHLE